MSKLKEKLKASIKPARGKVETNDKSITAKPAAKPASAATREPDARPQARPIDRGSKGEPPHTAGLFPQRIWPD